MAWRLLLVDQSFSSWMGWDPCIPISTTNGIGRVSTFARLYFAKDPNVGRLVRALSSPALSPPCPTTAAAQKKSPGTQAGAVRLHHRDGGRFDDPNHAPGSWIDDHAPVIDIGIRVVAVPRDRIDVHGPRQRLAHHDFLSDPIIAARVPGHETQHVARELDSRADRTADDATDRSAGAIALTKTFLGRRLRGRQRRPQRSRCDNTRNVHLPHDVLLLLLTSVDE